MLFIEAHQDCQCWMNAEAGSAHVASHRVASEYLSVSLVRYGVGPAAARSLPFSVPWGVVIGNPFTNRLRPLIAHSWVSGSVLYSRSPRYFRVAGVWIRARSVAAALCKPTSRDVDMTPRYPIDAASESTRPFKARFRKTIVTAPGRMSRFLATSGSAVGSFALRALAPPCQH